MTPPLPERVDVAVVGDTPAAFVVARALADQGASVAVLGRATHLGVRAGDFGLGLAAAGLAEHPWRLAASLGDATAKALHALGQAGVDHLGTLGLLDRCGLTWAATEGEREPGEIQKTAEVLSRWGVGHHVDADPHPFPAAIVYEDEGVVDAAALSALAAAAIAAGATHHPGVEVRGVVDGADGLHVATATGDVEAELVVLADGWRTAALDGRLADVLVPVREQAMTWRGQPTEPLALRAGYGWTSALARSDWLTVSGCRWASPHLATHETDPTVRDATVDERLAATAARFFDATWPADDVHAWIEAHGCDGLPVVGPLLGTPRLVVCAGFASLPWSLGIGCALQVAHGILTGQAEAVPAALVPDRFL